MLCGSTAITSDALAHPKSEGFLDRERPHELLNPTDPTSKLHPRRCPTLRYRYLDAHKEIQVPNIWYNQTKDMRIEYWAYEVATVQERIDLAHRQKARTKDLIDVQTIEARVARWHVQLAHLRQILDEVQQGVQFV